MERSLTIMSKKDEKTLFKKCLDLTVSLIAVSRDSVEVIVQKYAKGYRITINTANLTYYMIDYDVLADEKPHTIYREVEIRTMHDDVIRAIAVRTNDAEELMKLIQRSIKQIKNRTNVHNADGFIKLIPKPTWYASRDASEGVIRIFNNKRDDETIQSIVMLYSSELQMDIQYGGPDTGYINYRYQPNTIHISADAIELTHELLQFIKDLGGTYCEETCALMCNYINRMTMKPVSAGGQKLNPDFDHEIRHLIRNQRYTDPRDREDNTMDPFMEDNYF